MSSRLMLLLLLPAAPLLAALDPTLPPAGPLSAPAMYAAPVSAPRLQAILRGPQASSAVINGQRLQVGEQAGAIRVLQIEARRVLVQYRGSRQWLTLTAEFIVPRP